MRVAVAWPRQVAYVYNGTAKSAVVKETARVEVTKKLVPRPAVQQQARDGEGGEGGEGDGDGDGGSDSGALLQGDATTVAGSSSGSSSSSSDATGVAVGSTFGVSVALYQRECPARGGHLACRGGLLFDPGGWLSYSSTGRGAHAYVRARGWMDGGQPRTHRAHEPRANAFAMTPRYP